MTYVTVCRALGKDTHCCISTGSPDPSEFHHLQILFFTLPFSWGNVMGPLASSREMSDNFSMSSRGSKTKPQPTPLHTLITSLLQK